MKSMPLVDAVLLANAAPLFIPLVALFWMRTPIRPAVALSLAGGFIGVILILKPGPALLHNASSLIAITAALFSAVALVSVNRLSSTEKSDTILFYYFLISTIATLPFAAMQWRVATRDGMALSPRNRHFHGSFTVLYHRRLSARDRFSNRSFQLLGRYFFWNDRVDRLGHSARLDVVLGILLVCAGGIFSIVFTAHSQSTLHSFAWPQCSACSGGMNVVRSFDAQCVWRDEAIVGESPLWSVAESALYWVDIRGRKVQRFDPVKTSNESVIVDDIVTSVNFATSHSFILTLRKQFAFMDWNTGQLKSIADPEPEREGNRFNDAACDRKGRL